MSGTSSVSAGEHPRARRGLHPAASHQCVHAKSTPTLETTAGVVKKESEDPVPREEFEFETFGC